MILGACSRMLLYSSPRRTPEPMAWVSCSMAASMPEASVPAMTNCLLTCSMNAMISSLLEKAFPAISPSFDTASAVAWYAPLDRSADRKIMSCSSCVVCSPSFIMSRRAVVDIIWSDSPSTFDTV